MRYIFFCELLNFLFPLPELLSQRYFSAVLDFFFSVYIAVLLLCVAAAISFDFLLLLPPPMLI